MINARVPKDIVILGNGVASLAAVTTLRKQGFRGGITVVSDEREPTYARMLTPYFLSGRLSREALQMVPSTFHKSLGVKLLLGVPAVAVDPEARTVMLADSRRLGYDRLLVATGARPVLPDIPGIRGKGVHGLRTLAQAEKISQSAEPGEPLVVLGGGLVSLMTAEALLRRGMNVTVVMNSPHALSQQMTGEASCRIETILAAEGVRFLAGRHAVAVNLDAQGRAQAVRLDYGQTLPCRLLVVGKGIAPCTEALQGTALSLESALKVNKYLESHLPGIFAAGDVAEAPDLLEGKPRVVATQTNALQQGQIAALNIICLHVPDLGGLPLNSMHFGSVRAVSCGRSGRAQAGEREEIMERPESYRRFVFHDDRLVGITFIGDIVGAGRLVRLIRRRVPLRGNIKRVVSYALGVHQCGEIW